MIPGVSIGVSSPVSPKVWVMGIRSALTMRRYQQAVSAAYRDPSTMPLASPWAGPSSLSHIAVPDIFGDVPMNTRGSAMRLAPIRRARNLLVTTISRLPLIDLHPGAAVPRLDLYPDRATYATAYREWASTQPSWMYRTDDGSTPQHRMAWTVDDLIFHPASLWWKQIGSDGLPLRVGRVNRDEWDINSDNRIEIRGTVQSDDEVILIPGLSDGILRDGVDVLRDARSLGDIVRKRLKNPIPALDLHQTSGEPLQRHERRELVESWSEALAGDNGGVSYTNQFVEARVLGGGMDGELMIEARNASAVDQARIVGVGASRVDASSGDSLTYDTRQSSNQALVDFDLALYMLPIAARLSMDDCVPRGHRADFDLYDFLQNAASVTGAERQD